MLQADVLDLAAPRVEVAEYVAHVRLRQVISTFMIVAGTRRIARCPYLGRNRAERRLSMMTLTRAGIGVAIAGGIALAEPEMRWLLLARSELVCRREFLSLVLPALRDPSYIGLSEREDVTVEHVTVEGRNMRLHDHGTIAVRSCWVSQATIASIH